ncbi:MAG: outer membrane beta-barrel protein [Bacteroidetes bacterium]|nr:outer membrane beta-barrel protein [Bacteroidota bacterium]
MKCIRALSALLLLSTFSYSQNVHIGVFGGAGSYNGDLVDKLFPGHGQTKGAFGFDLEYEYNEHINIRAGYTYGHVSGYDKFNKSLELQKRNLGFESVINEISLVGEYNIFNLYETRFTPYIYTGIAVFHYDPYVYDAGNIKTYLKPLSTEGEGITGYNNRPYSLTQPAIPLGVGIKYAITDNVRIGLEAGYRVLFTDYLDDVSKNYIDAGDLLAARGQRAVDLAYRGDEVPGGSPFYPGKGVQRGNSSSKDAYYFVGLHLTFRLMPSAGNGYGQGRSGRSKKGYGCPTNVL